MKLSIVIPVYNEAENLVSLLDELYHAMEKQSYPWEVIFVDDGSVDTSWEVIKKFAEADPRRVIAISFRRNFGQTAAIEAGIDHAMGDVIVFMDADMQNDPNDIPMMLEKIYEGYDLVSGWRVNRKDNYLLRVMPSRIANALISWVTGVRLHDYGCTLKAYRRDVITGFRLYGEMHRFIPAYAGSVGAKIIEVPVNHRPRRFGKTKYGLERTIKVILDLVTVKFLISYALKPIYLFGGTGLFLMILSALTLLFLMIRRIWLEIPVSTSPFLPTATMLMILGFQSILMGLIAELLVRTYHEAQSKPTYKIREVISSKKEGK
ncbi:MAG: glycosyltransferase family 2 protein [Anaerolineales bacterium]|nr:glycosyltransferase family 2 protein [Anaerolineales bacterium]